ncbi:MAG TPA: sugar phosphate isomerase/epimerase family protein [Vicinamibacterales bacterium]
MTTYQYAISTHLYHDQRLSRDHMREIAAHGFAAIELFATRTHFDYHDPGAIGLLAEWLKETGLILHSVHAPISEALVGTRWGGMFTNATTDESARERAVSESRAALAIADRIPFRFLVTHVGIPDALKPTVNDNQHEPARRSIIELHSTAQSRGVRLALEVIPNSLSSAEALVDLIENNLDLPDIGICMDFGHGFLMGDLVDAIETASGYLITTHIHDNHGKSDDHLVPFAGSIDWPAALMAAQKIGYDGALMFEVANTSTPTQVLTGIDKARKRFEGILGQ